MLKELLYKVKLKAVHGNTNVTVTSLHIDSRKVLANTCFIAINGVETNGHNYIDSAIKNGAIAIVVEILPTNIVDGITYIQVENTSEAAGIMAHNFFGEPSNKFKLIGVTGTNGKTTVATILYNLFTKLGHVCGLISTVENKIGTTVFSATHTTPDAISLNALLKNMYDNGCKYVFMECSSHAIFQDRIAGLNFAGGIFTNITHDHLDYHKTFDEYIRVKKSWFDNLPTNAFAISNADDKRGAVMLQNTNAKKYYYSLRTISDFKGKILDNSLSGLHMMINEVEVYFKLIGEFNAYNLLSVYAAAISLGLSKEEVLLALSNINGAEGRFDYQVSKIQKNIGIVDYAHTPDALLNVLVTIKKLKHGNEKIITVVGCGGDRDKAKRPIMAEVACGHSDKVILTSDNPRSEKIEDIIQEMEAGINVVSRRKYISITDRREAIKTAVSLCNEDDIVLIAGKGHEKYQEINGIKFEFDDKKVLAEMFDLLGK
ncbi:MAG: UDP-N-acetylmuramoyl-L-alanyl-D-glutamate--2,6-diaminopimelate ligase [Ferruginibacter sp.]|nr:UDP-N-acetylmuramoyl-L-alanyl-D-glutamate--2,6-diaminopimelate ligase [Ferruginibacter sp.]